ncbi:hypothetical protein Tco_0368271 [Tanacetum coccineum]
MILIILSLEVWSITFLAGLQIQHVEDLTAFSPYPTSALTTAFGPTVVTLLNLRAQSINRPGRVLIDVLHLAEEFCLAAFNWLLVLTLLQLLLEKRGVDPERLETDIQEKEQKERQKQTNPSTGWKGQSQKSSQLKKLQLEGLKLPNLKLYYKRYQVEGL